MLCAGLDRLSGGVILGSRAFGALLLVLHVAYVLVSALIRSDLFGDHVLLGLLLAAGLAHRKLRVILARGIFATGLVYLDFHRIIGFCWVLNAGFLAGGG